MSNSISGNAGVGLATVGYTGNGSPPLSGSVMADGSGNYSISGLDAGTYLITPTSSGYDFSPESRSETIVASNITGVDFTAIVATETNFLGVGLHPTTRRGGQA